MFDAKHRFAFVILGWLLTFPVSARQGTNSTNAGSGPAVTNSPFQYKGTVVCYDEGWNQLYVYNGKTTRYFNPNIFNGSLAKGLEVEIKGEISSRRELSNLKLVVTGTNTLPPAGALELSQLTNGFGQWVSVSGWVRSVENTRGRLALVLQEKQQNCLVYVMGGSPTNDFNQLVGSKVRLTGVNASKVVSGRLESALFFASGLDDITTLEGPDRKNAEIPVAYIGSLLNRELGSWTNDPVHINGLVVSYEPGDSLVVKDPTGLIRAQVFQQSPLQTDERVDIWGFLEVSAEATVLKNAYFQTQRRAVPPVANAPIEKVSTDTSNLPETLTQLGDILKLKREEAARHIPVRLRGVITYADPEWHNGFIQDKGEAIYIDLVQRDVKAGQWVELSGVTSPGGFAPEVTNTSVKVLGYTNFPTPAKLELQDLANGHFDAHWVQMEGVVRRVDAQWGHLNLSLMTQQGRFKVVIPGFGNKPIPDNLIDAMLRVEGACSTEANGRLQISGVTLLVPTYNQVEVIERPPADPFTIAPTPIETVAIFDPDRPAGRRVKIHGVVTLKIPGQGFIAQDATGGMQVYTRQAKEVQIGDVVDVLGFPVIGDFSPYLEEADFRRLGAGTLPVAKKKTAEQILQHGTNDAQIVEIKARLLQSVPRSANPQLSLQDGPIIFTSHVANQGRRVEVPELESGTLLRLTGVCLIHGSETHEPVTFQLLLSDPASIEVLEAPPWWTPRHTLMLGGGMMLVIAAVLAWVASLRRRVRTQTEIVRQKLEREAALEKRYRDLFENANDMVYTHDLAGHISSINQAGELLLQRSREQILGRNIVDLIVEEQRGAAREWLSQVIRGAETSATEWDLISSAGRRIKMEISTRRIQRGLELIEVEGIARDVTERRRLEREILEISSREQQRIGHDLHDGVCQQLAGISFMTASLAHSLKQKNNSETGKAERIATLLNVVMNQTRSVARGLFPVRLEENGLVSALEELASNASELFKIDCRFICEQPPASVDNGIAQHLYYIALEAVTNASKHGHAKKVLVTLEPSGDRYLLGVEDNGVGMPVSGPHQTGMGVRIMQYRTRVIGATLTLQRGADSGTHVTCLFLPASREVNLEGGERTVANGAPMGTHS